MYVCMFVCLYVCLIHFFNYFLIYLYPYSSHLSKDVDSAKCYLACVCSIQPARETQVDLGLSLVSVELPPGVLIFVKVASTGAWFLLFFCKI